VHHVAVARPLTGQIGQGRLLRLVRVVRLFKDNGDIGGVQIQPVIWDRAWIVDDLHEVVSYNSYVAETNGSNIPSCHPEDRPLAAQHHWLSSCTP